MTLDVYMCAKRKVRGVSQSALVRRCRELDPDVRGISERAIRDWETGKRGRRPGLDQFDLIADALELTAEERLRALRLARVGAARI
jgi:transcriptional regulator with XRE-family HTH domain